jgi:alkyl hydroperoxide reductase subunit AhpF
MALLKDSDRAQLQKEFEQLTNPVKLILFTQELDCDYCPLTQEILEELTGLSDKIQLQTYNYANDKDQVLEYKIARVPAIALVRVETIGANGASETRDRDYGIRYYGVPSGYEFASLVGDIIDVSKGDSGLSAASKAALAQLTEPLHLQVFTTPT